MRWRGSKEREPAGDDWFVTGLPVAGTEEAVDAIERNAPAGAARLVAVDPAFDEKAFVAWAGTVYERAVAAWRTRDPRPLRPVMDAAVWDSYAKHLVLMSTIPVVQSMMAAARAEPELTGATGDAGHHDAIVTFQATTDPVVYATWDLPVEHRTWSERWLFQRPGSFRTHPSGMVQVCPVCGAPAQPEETGRCRYCQADITSRTSGWLVTMTATTMAGMAKMDAGAARLRADVSAKVDLPPAPIVSAPLQPPRAGPPAQP